MFLQLRRLSTNIPDHLRASLEDESISVIHAPQGYNTFVSGVRARQYLCSLLMINLVFWYSRAKVAAEKLELDHPKTLAA